MLIQRSFDLKSLTRACLKIIEGLGSAIERSKSKHPTAFESAADDTTHILHTENALNE